MINSKDLKFAILAMLFGAIVVGVLFTDTDHAMLAEVIDAAKRKLEADAAGGEQG